MSPSPFVFLADGTEGFVFTAGDDPVTASGAEEPLEPDAAEVVTTESGVPFASALSKSGKVVSGSGEVPEFFQRIVAAWKPAVAANKYEVQFSKKKKAWKTLKRKFTVGTQLQVKLAPGTWYYRVCGLDLSLPGSPGLAWSDPVEVEMIAPTFTIVSN